MRVFSIDAYRSRTQLRVPQPRIASASTASPRVLRTNPTCHARVKGRLQLEHRENSAHRIGEERCDGSGVRPSRVGLHRKRVPEPTCRVAGVILQHGRPEFARELHVDELGTEDRSNPRPLHVVGRPERPGLFGI